MTNEVKKILVMREIRRNVEKLNRNHCSFEYGELKEVFNINNHLSYEGHKKEDSRKKFTVTSEKEAGNFRPAFFKCNRFWFVK